MLTDSYMSDITRQRILREVVNRAQKSVFDVAYAWYFGLALTGIQDAYDVLGNMAVQSLRKRPLECTPSCADSIALSL